MGFTADSDQGAAEAGDGPALGAAAEQVLQLVHSTSAASRRLRRKLGDVAASCALSDAELLVLWLCHGEGRVQVELAGAIGISPAQMSGLVERLRGRGLIEMQKQALDRRRQVWRTSPAGEAVFRQISGRLDEVGAAISDALPPAEQRAFTTVCQRLVEAVAALAAAQRGSKEAA